MNSNDTTECSTTKDFIDEDIWLHTGRRREYTSKKNELSPDFQLETISRNRSIVNIVSTMEISEV